MIIDAWGQHPTVRQIQDPIFDSLRRWTKSLTLNETPSVASTISALDEGGVERMLISAWYAPNKIMISNDEVFDLFSNLMEDSSVLVQSVLLNLNYL
jgi:hypothetical protein